MSSPEQVIAQLEAELAVARKWGERRVRDLHRRMLKELERTVRRLRKAEARVEAASLGRRRARRRALAAERELAELRSSITWRAGASWWECRPGSGDASAADPTNRRRRCAHHRTPPAPATVAVLNSCISRDNFNSRFNPDYKRWFVCPLHQNQSSLISLMSSPTEATWSPTRTMSDYDRWNVETELDKSFLRKVVELRPDYVVLDFFGDVHFGCVQLDTGEYLTDNRWKVRTTDLYVRLQEEGRLRRVDPYTDRGEYADLWSDAFARLVAHLRSNLPETRLVLHRGHNTTVLRRPDRPEPVPFGRRRAAFDVDAANAWWAELDDRAAGSCDAVVDLTDRVYPTSKDHPWGPFYVHYSMDYYHRFLAELTRVDLARTVTPELADRFALIEAAADERAALDAAGGAAVLEQLRGRVRRLRARVRELEEQRPAEGPGRRPGRLSPGRTR